MASQTSNTAAFPIIDSHIHLYAKTHIPTLAWTGDLPADHPLNRQRSVEDYKAVSARQTNLLGFVFLETDRKSGLGNTDWEDALKEVDFLVRIATGSPVEGEGHVPEDSRLVLGVVPWAPVPAGTSLLAEYVENVQTRFSNAGIADRLKGFRYLVQSRPAGTMLQAEFIEGLQWLGEQDLVFDLGVDAREGGLHQLEEACTMMQRVYTSGSRVKIIINHFCKPNLHLTASHANEGHPDFLGWKENIEKMASYPSTYMKLSGWFSELPPQNEGHPEDIARLVERTRPWADVVFKAFTPSRILFGSDWPVCGVGGPGNYSWQHWHDLVEAILESQNASAQSKKEVWSGTAAQAYNIKI
ncbi:uncharacterized protein A1O9_08142 [Exophiala aquamarina CBS 119918]|uniref:Amidohydrolase-related domain-containing protein n=1 Tax=Exophiala aquamarina CBS 119918 TaxID=1182545 RepID=A0A072P6P5_9EURO|nr:uncharacterized protein A1O9_08142 [Exophiala aquamarina CBS 119918]KEF55392.1 hypothetical protein A1O9_08142 [Exophiala aquamarina CBS 119918]